MKSLRCCLNYKCKTWPQLSGEYRNQLTALWDESFQCSHYISHYPFLFQGQSNSKIHWLEEKGKIQAALVTHPFHWTHANSKGLRACGLGSVAVQAQNRGRGLGLFLLKSVMQELSVESCDFVFLFSHQEKLYSKVGFQRAYPDVLLDLRKTRNSLQLDPNDPYLMVKKSNQNRVNVWELSDLKKEERNALSPLKQLQEFWMVNAPKSWPNLTWDFWKGLFDLSDTKVFVLESKKNQEIVATFFAGKGIDFKNVAHSFIYQNEEACYALMGYAILGRDQEAQRLENLLVNRELLVQDSKLPMQISHSIMVRWFSENQKELALSSFWDMPGIASC